MFYQRTRYFLNCPCIALMSQPGEFYIHPSPGSYLTMCGKMNFTSGPLKLLKDSRFIYQMLYVSVRETKITLMVINNYCDMYYSMFDSVQNGDVNPLFLCLHYSLFVIHPLLVQAWKRSTWPRLPSSGVKFYQSTNILHVSAYYYQLYSSDNTGYR